MSILPASAYEMELPQMHRVVQIFDDRKLEDVEGTIRKEMRKEEIRHLVKPGMRVALAVGSRGISNMALITRTVGEELKAMGAIPFIVPAMGSHGNATAEGQAEVLAGYGITEETMGFPVISSMEVEELGVTKSGVPICIDKNANHADMIVPLGRVKPHTDFKGPIESGLCKMLTIGLGKHEGCSRLHQQGFVKFPSLIPEAAGLVIEKAPVGFGIAIIENSYDETFHVEAVPAERIHEREPELLKIAREKMPSIQLKDIDVCVIDTFGKDISGAGMDPNITGRTTKGEIANFQGPHIQRIVVRSLTEATHGNACGIGLADYILQSCSEQIDLPATFTNSIGSGNPEAGRIPIRVESVREGIIASLRTCVGADIFNPKIVFIKNTLSLREIWVSDALLSEVSENPGMQLLPDVRVCE